MISISWASCQKKLTVKDELAGKKVKCPGCGKAVTVPQLAASLSPQPGSSGISANLTDERTLPQDGHRDTRYGLRLARVPVGEEKQP